MSSSEEPTCKYHHGETCTRIPGQSECVVEHICRRERELRKIEETNTNMTKSFTARGRVDFAASLAPRNA